MKTRLFCFFSAFLIFVLHGAGQEVPAVPPLLWTNAHLQGWYRADLGTVLVTNEGTRTTLWLDQSFHARHLEAQAGYAIDPPVNLRSPERRPFFRSNVVNHLPALEFQGSLGSCMYGPVGPINMRQFTVLVVYKEMAHSANRSILGWRNATINDAKDDGDFNSTNPAYPFTTEKGTNALCFQQNSMEGVKYRAGISGSGVDNRRYRGDRFTLATFGFSTNLYLRRNAQTFGVAAVPPAEGDCIVDFFHISAHTYPHDPSAPNGLWTNDGRNEGQNQFAEILIFDATLSAADLAVAEDYLMAKYALPYAGDLSLQSARRALNNHSQVTIVFSKPPQLASATNARNYMIYSAADTIPIEQVTPGPDGKTFILSTMLALDDGVEYELQVDDVLDSDGKTLPRSESIKKIASQRLDPAEIAQAQTVAGFLDDFNGPRRNGDWVVRGAGGDVYELQSGLLRVRSAGGSANHLAYEPASGYDRFNQEILARVRVLASDATQPSGGVATAIDASGIAQNWGFQKTGFVQLASDGGPAQSAPFDWKRQTWYWLREQMVTDESGTTVRGRIWPADGDSAEPSAWQEWKPASGSKTGFAGVQAGTDNHPADFEIDWILIKAAGLPNTPVTGPGPVRPVLSIRQEGGKPVVRWPRWASGQLEQNDALQDAGWSQALGQFDQTDADFMFVPEAPNGSSFYRLVQ